MAIFKCKMCGGDLEIHDHESVAVCEYCGTKQTVPNLDDEKRAQLYSRANHFRRQNEFDKAMGIYELILAEDKEDAEAYWSIVLCRYGIEYVEDPKSHKRIPTINRAQYTSIFDDDDYNSAIKYADSVQKDVYEQEAKIIDDIQKGILDISQKEEPFDVFICYKETDEQGRRTEDSVYAQNIYKELTKEGYKVFFARITLEDKLGTAYEPYIFAALNSAKVMLVVGTNKDNFNAVWVKNEWSRYLTLANNDDSKSIIPLYKDMDPYDLPDEFSYLQAQDMGKIGYLQDLVHGIDKLFGKDQNVIRQSSNTNNNEKDFVGAFLKRIFAFLQKGNFKSADEYCEMVIDLDPNNAQAYLGKLLIDLRVNDIESLKNLKEPFSDNKYYKKIINLSDDNLKSQLKDCIDQIIERNESERLEFERQTEIIRENLLKKKERNKRIIKIVIPIVCVAIVFVIILEMLILPPVKLKKANVLIESGDYISAYELLQEIDYKDSDEKLKKIYPQYLKEVLINSQVGYEFSFGTYEQDNDLNNGKEDIEWLVLDKQEDKMLIISKYALDCKQFNKEYQDSNWENTSVSKWLNDGFINEAFTQEEQEIILSTLLTTKKNSKMRTKLANSKESKIFLLSADEAKDYFSLKTFIGEDKAVCKPTAYAIANNVSISESGTCCWWLRTIDESLLSANYIDFEGEIDKCNVKKDDFAVRPAMWISLEH